MGALQHENVLLKGPLIGDMSPKMSEKTGKMSDKMSEKTVEKTEKVPKRCPKSAQKTYLAIVKNPNATIEELSKELGISERAVKKHQKLLKDANLITRLEGRKSGHWEIVQGEENE